MKKSRLARDGSFSQVAEKFIRRSPSEWSGIFLLEGFDRVSE